MVNRGEEKVWVQMNVVLRDTGRGFDSHRGQKIFSFTIINYHQLSCSLDMLKLDVIVHDSFFSV